MFCHLLLPSIKGGRRARNAMMEMMGDFEIESGRREEPKRRGKRTITMQKWEGGGNTGLVRNMFLPLGWVNLYHDYA